MAGHSKKRKTKVAILKIILYLTGSQWSDFSSGLTCSCLLLFKIYIYISLRGSEIFAACTSEHS